LYPHTRENNEDILFYYVFIPKKNKETRKELIARKRNILNKLNSILALMYQSTNEN